MISTPGIYAITAEEYHLDVCPSPSLSASIIKSLVNESPLHAWTKHPRLNPNVEREEAKHFDIGTLSHALLLEGRDVAVVIQAENYRTKLAQEARDSARAAGKCPILAHELPEIEAMILAARLQIDAHAEASDAFTNGKPEQTIVWQEPNGVWCRCRPDWLHDSLDVIDDYKTGSGSMHPAQISRNMFRDGWPITAAWYLRGLRAVTGIDGVYRFVCQETYAPHALSIVGCDPATLALANDQVEWAIDEFGRCLSTGTWLGYAARIAYPELPTWEQERWLTAKQ